MKNKKILLTYGPTCVAIDNMRIISNRSTGELGQFLAKSLLKKGAALTILEGPVLKPLHDKKLNVRRYFYYDELEKILNSELKKKHDVVIHAAAISDYKLAKPFTSKLSSHLKQLTLTLVPTKKLINTIKQKSPETFLVGFKLVDKVNKNTLAGLGNFLKENKCDLAVVNSLKQDKYHAVIVDQKCSVLDQAKNRQELSKKLIKNLTEKLN